MPLSRHLQQCLRLTCGILLTSLAFAQQPSLGDGWPTYGGDAGGTRYSTSNQITRANLSQLHPAWTFHTHALDRDQPGRQVASFEATPILFGDTLYFTSPFDVVFALDARTGQQRWSYDPQLKGIADDGLTTSRGVAFWQSPTALAQCTRRIFFGTLDARLIAIDADSGKPCPNFGNSGNIDLKKDVHFQNVGYYSETSPPTVIGNVVVIGSSIGDNQQVDIESGLVRAFNAVTGVQLWSWEPLPWAANAHPRTGAGNVWSIISADPDLGLVYLPTSSASPDYYGGLRPGDNRDADSVVALDAKTGRRVWAFQTIHHNLWDYDIPSEPLLFTFRHQTPALAITTKTGQVFVLDRRTGQPLYPVEERPVPQSDVPGETSWPTQPFSTLPSLSPLTPPPDNPTGWQRSPANAAYCREQLAKLRYDGTFTPASLTGSLLFPGNLGGVNWGGAAFDPTTATLYANVNRELFAMTLIRRTDFHYWWSFVEPDIRDWPIWLYIAAGILIFNIVWHLETNRLAPHPIHLRPWLPSLRATISAMLVALMAAVVCIFPRTIDIPHFGHELSPQHGTPYLIQRDPILDHDDHPCIAPPWGSLAALNLDTGKMVWQSPLGTDVSGEHTGSLTLGGPIVTAAGLIFTAATKDAQLRAFDSTTGEQLWSAPLPASARSTPMTYTLDGRQYIVIAAGGHGGVLGDKSDALVAFALN